MKEVKEMTDKELKREYLAISDHINVCSYGRYELFYQNELAKELYERGYEIQSSEKIIKT